FAVVVEMPARHPPAAIEPILLAIDPTLLHIHSCVTPAYRPRPNIDTGGEFIFLPTRELREDQGQRESDPTPAPDCRWRARPMSLRPQPPCSIPEETYRVAHAAFPKGTLCLRIADDLGDLYRDD